MYGLVFVDKSDFEKASKANKMCLASLVWLVLDELHFKGGKVFA